MLTSSTMASILTANFFCHDVSNISSPNQDNMFEAALNKIAPILDSPKREYFLDLIQSRIIDIPVRLQEEICRIYVHVFSLLQASSSPPLNLLVLYIYPSIPDHNASSLVRRP